MNRREFLKSATTFSLALPIVAAAEMAAPEVTGPPRGAVTTLPESWTVTVINGTCGPVTITIGECPL